MTSAPAVLGEAEAEVEVGSRLRAQVSLAVRIIDMGVDVDDLLPVAVLWEAV